MNKTPHCILLLLLLTLTNAQNTTLNLRPIIGILALPSDDKFYPYYPASNYSYISSPFCKFAQSAGSRVSPIPYDLPQSDILALLKGVNGLLLTGGNSTLWTWNQDGTKSPTDLYLTMQFIVNTAIQWNQQGDFFPLWGTQQGMAVILSVIADDLEILDNITLSGRNVGLNFLEDTNSTKLYSLFTPDIWAYSQNTSLFWAQSNYGINITSFEQSAVLSSMFRPLTQAVDDTGKQFITSLEGIDLPVYLVHFNPEINAFDWSNKAYFHSFDSIKAAQKMAFQFVNNSRLNWHAFPNDTVENSTLIYNYNVTMLPDYATPVYFFPNYGQSEKIEVYG